MIKNIMFDVCTQKTSFEGYNTDIYYDSET